MRSVSERSYAPKVLGADIELGNCLLGHSHPESTGTLASRLLLRNIDGTAGIAVVAGKEDPQDIGRKWLTNGSCCYIDLDHLEMALPETRSAWDFTAAFHAQLQIVEEARRLATASLPTGTSLQALACNSDGNGSSWGSHLNFLLTRECYDRIYHHRLDVLLWLASYQASSLPIVGQGKVGSENGNSTVDYQLSQRADFIEEIVGLQTTYRRPIINSRDEPLCDGNRQYARFHHISCDVNLCHTANVLKTGILQILLSMVEIDSSLINIGLILKEPVRAFRSFSHDANLTLRQPTLAGEQITALDLQRRFCDAAAEFVATDACIDTVPRASDIVSLWSDTLELLAARNWEQLSRRLDWVLKRSLLQEIIAESPVLSWDSQEIKWLDLLYGSLDRDEGLYWAMEKAGQVDMLVSDSEIRLRTCQPPSDTRAYTRGKLIQKFRRDSFMFIDWDRIRIRRPNHGSYSRALTISLNDPIALTAADTGHLFRDGTSHDAILETIASWNDPGSAGAMAHVDDTHTIRHPDPYGSTWGSTTTGRH